MITFVYVAIFTLGLVAGIAVTTLYLLFRYDGGELYTQHDKAYLFNWVHDEQDKRAWVVLRLKKEKQDDKI